jgi:hypothetical protein
MSLDVLERLRALCLSFPETSERPSHGAPTFFIQAKKAFLMFMNDHYGDGRLAVWCAAPSGSQQALQAEAPDWFFVPPYVGHRGWIGIRLDRNLDWDEFAEYVAEAYCAAAPPKLVAQLDPKPGGSPR